jgi:Spy/CpxP family protein refolding chaperone
MQARTSERRTWRMAAFAATAFLTLTSVAAMAQPAGPAGPWHGHGRGPGGGMGIEQVLASVKDQLNLDPTQLRDWTDAVAATKAAHVTARANMQAVHDALVAELANPTPDLGKVATVADGVHAGNQALRQGVRNQWLQLYATLSADQKAVVRDALAKQLARMETMGARMRGHMQQGG